MAPRKDGGDRRPRDASASEGTGSVRVVYIAGSGRSGSTVLAALLGGHPELASVGELDRLPDDGWIRDDYCACGRRAGACDFWTAVRARWERLAPRADPSFLAALQRRLTGRGRSVRLLLPDSLRGRSFEAFEAETLGLLRAVGREAATGTVVDASKSPARAMALQRIGGVDLRVVHLVRDGRGVLSSLKKGYAEDARAGIPHDIPPRPTWRVAALWVGSNLLAEALGRLVGPKRYARVRYEDLVRDPAGALEGLQEVVGHGLRSVGERAARGEGFSTGHMIAGNRVRMQDEVRLRPERGRWGPLEGRDRWLFPLLAGPVLRRYGYGRDG